MPRPGPGLVSSMNRIDLPSSAASAAPSGPSTPWLIALLRNSTLAGSMITAATQPAGHVVDHGSDHPHAEHGHGGPDDPDREVVDQHLEPGAHPVAELVVEELEHERGQRSDDHGAEEHRDLRADDDAHRGDCADHGAALPVDQLAARVADEDGQEVEDHRLDEGRILLVRQPAVRDEQGGDQPPGDEGPDVGHHHPGEVTPDALDRRFHPRPLDRRYVGRFHRLLLLVEGGLRRPPWRRRATWLGHPGIVRARSSSIWSVTYARRPAMSSGPGTPLPGRSTAAAAQRSAVASASLPAPPAARNPASRQSPAPTVLRRSATGQSPRQTPPSSARTAPSGPRLTRTVRAPALRIRSAARTASAMLRTSRPSASPTSSRLGFTSAGPASMACRRAGPDVSIATSMPASVNRRVRSA